MLAFRRLGAMRPVRLAVQQQQRTLAAAPAGGAKGKVYQEKTFYEAWCSDSGAYPVMGVIAFAVVFSLGYGLKVMMVHPDARWGKSSRTTIFRGELRGTPLE